MVAYKQRLLQQDYNGVAYKQRLLQQDYDVVAYRQQKQLLVICAIISIIFIIISPYVT